jgi:hypothetical protein
MEVGQGQNWSCSAKGKKIPVCNFNNTIFIGPFIYATENRLHKVEFEVLTVVTARGTVFWVVTPCDSRADIASIFRI